MRIRSCGGSFILFIARERKPRLQENARQELLGSEETGGRNRSATVGDERGPVTCQRVEK